MSIENNNEDLSLDDSMDPVEGIEILDNDDDQDDTDEQDEQDDAAADSDDDSDEEDEGDEPEESHPGAIDDSQIAAALEAAKKKDVTTQPPAFAPDFKVKAYGNEYEIPEKFRALMTDEASANEIRQVFEKSFALDAYKPKQEANEQKISHYEQKVLPAYAKQDQVINECVHYLKNGDYDSYFETLGVPVEGVMKWMEKKLNFTPEQQALYDQNRALMKQGYKQGIESSQLKSSNEQLVSDSQRAEGENRLKEFEYHMSSGDIAQKVAAYDAKNGKHSFRNLAIRHGHYATTVEGRNLTDQQVINEALSRIAPPQASATPGKTTQLAEPKVKQALPVVRPRPTSPTLKKPNSIADIRKKAARLNGVDLDE